MYSPMQRVDLGKSFGSLFIGILLGAVLFGISNVQTFFYFYTRRRTGITFYALAVAYLWVLDALHLAVIAHCVYHYLVTDFANIGELSRVVWSFKLHIVFDVFIIFSVHSLYLHRIWKASSNRSRVIPVAIVIIVMMGFGFAIFAIRSAYRVHVFADFRKVPWITFASLSIVTLTDALIASSLCYILATSRTGFSSIDSFVAKLLGFVINTGALTSMCSLTALITYAAMQDNFIFLSIEFLFPKLYINSFIGLLNARYYTQGGYYDIKPKPSSAAKEQFRRTSKMRSLESAWPDSLCILPDDDVLYPARPPTTLINPHRGITIEVQMESLSD